MVQVRGYSEEEVDVLADSLSEMIVASLLKVAGQTADQLQPALTAAHVFHMPGKHDQKSHGHKTTVSSGEVAGFKKRLSKARTGDKARKKTPSTEELRGKKLGHGSWDVTDAAIQGHEVEDYQRNGHILNGMLRDGRTPRATEFDDEGVGRGFAGRDAHDGLSRAFSDRRTVLRDDIVVERGVPDPRSTFGDSWNPEGGNEGLTWDDAGYTSATFSPSVASQFATGSGFADTHASDIRDPVQMRILVPAGSHALAIDAQTSLPDVAWEDEVVLPSASQFRVMVDHGVGADGIHLVDVEYVGPSSFTASSATSLVAATSVEFHVPNWIDIDGPVHVRRKAIFEETITASSSAGLGPSDVAVLTDLWEAEVNGQLLPYVSQVYTGSAVGVAVGLADGFPDAILPGVPMIPDEFTQTFLRSVSGSFVGIGDDVFEDVREILVQGVKNGESIEQIAAKMRYVTEFSQTRATEIARTVVHSASESGSLAQMRFVGYGNDNAVKEWVSAHDARVRPSHVAADNQRVPLDQSFTVGAVHLDFPGDPSGPSAEVRQCRCTMFFDVDEVPKLRCGTALTAATSGQTSQYCVVPTPSVAAIVAPDVKVAITAAWPKVTPAYGGAAIHKAILVVRAKLAQQGISDKDLDDWTILSVMDEASPSKGAFTFTSKYHAYAESPAGKKLGIPPPKTAPTHAVAPIDTVAPTPQKLPPVAPKPDPGEIQFTGQVLGSHGAQVWRNPVTGERWLFKPQKQYATDLDIGTAKIQSAAGATRPGVYEIELGGQKGSIQFMFDSQEAFPHGSFDPLKLSAEDILEIQQTQIFDWLISNFDTHSGQWIRLSTGQLFGTDKGQAFKFFGHDVLDWDYIPVTPLGSDKLVYQPMWKAYVSGADIDLMDPTKGPLADYIARIMAIPDAEYRKMLKAYADAKGKPSPGEFLDLAVARKNSLADDWAEFWARAQAERAKHVTVAPTAPPPVPTPVVQTSLVKPPPITSITELKDTQKWDIMEMFLAANKDVKVTPAWGGAKIWKLVKAVMEGNKDDPSMPLLTERQILEVLDEVGGFQGKKKTYVSVVSEWLDSPAGKKAVPVKPASFKPAPTPAGVKHVKPTDPDALDTLVTGEAKAPLDVMLSLDLYSPGDVMGYASQGKVILRISRSEEFPDSVKIEKSEDGVGGAWEYVDTVDDMTDLSGLSKIWYMKTAQASDPWSSGVKPVTPVVPTQGSHIVGKAIGDEVHENEVLLAKAPPNSVIAVSVPKPGTSNYRVIVDENGAKKVQYLSGTGKWTTDSAWDVDSMGLPSIGVQAWKASGAVITDAKPLPVSKIPGKMPGDSVTSDEISASKYLWSADEEIALGPLDNVGGRSVLISNGHGDVELWYRLPNGDQWKVKVYPAGKPLPKSIYGVKPGEWKLSGSTLTPSVPSPKTKPSALSGFNEGDVVDFEDMQSAAPDLDIMQLAYGYSTGDQSEYRVVYYFGSFKMQMRPLGQKQWDDIAWSTDGIDDFHALVDKVKFYAATKNGAEPDAYKAMLPNASKTPAGAKTPATVPGKYVGDDLFHGEIMQTTGPPGTVIAEGVNPVGTKFRIIIDADGKKMSQLQQTTSGKWVNWQPVPNATKIPPQVAWKAVASTETKAGTKAATPPTPTPKKKLTGKQTHVPNKETGDTASGDEIWGNWQHYVDGQIIATKTSWAGTYRLFVANGKLIIQKQTKAGTWAGTKIVQTKWDLPSINGWTLRNEMITAQHLKNAQKFVDKKTSPAPPAGTPGVTPAGQTFKGYAPGTPEGYTPTPPLPQVARFLGEEKPQSEKPQLIPPDLDMTGFTDQDVKDIAASRKILLSSSPAQLFDAMEAVLKEWKLKGGKYASLTLGHVIRFYDFERDKRKGITIPSYAYEKKIVEWWTEQGGPRLPAGVTTTLRFSSPLRSRDLPVALHRLDDPSNPDRDSQSYKFITHDAAAEHQKDMEVKYGRVTQEQRAGVADYTGGHYTSINHAIRDGEVASSPYRHHIEGAIRAMRPSTRPIKLLRFTGWREFLGVDSYEKLLARVGQTFISRRLLSTTIKQRRTYSAASQVEMELECPIGTPMVYAQVKGGQSSEFEMIIAPHVMFEIKSVTRTPGGHVKVVMRAIGYVDTTKGGV